MAPGGGGGGACAPRALPLPAWGLGTTRSLVHNLLQTNFDTAVCKFSFSRQTKIKAQHRINPAKFLQNQSKLQKFGWRSIRPFSFEGRMKIAVLNPILPFLPLQACVVLRDKFTRMGRDFPPKTVKTSVPAMQIPRVAVSAVAHCVHRCM